MAEFQDKRGKRAVARRKPERFEDGPAVTYSRVRDSAQPAHDFDDGADGQFFDAVEVPHVDRPPPLADFDEFPSLRESDIDPEEDLGAIGGDEPRRRLFPLIAFGVGIVALAIGVGVLYATIDSASEPVSTVATPEAAEPAPAPTEASLEAPVRAIPLTADGKPLETAPGTIGTGGFTAEPPEPRIRPEPKAAAAVEPAAPEAPAPAIDAAEVAPATAGGDEDFIRNIESTLSRIQPQEDGMPVAPAPAANGSAVIDAAPEPLPQTVAVPTAEQPSGSLIDDADGSIMHAEGDIFADPVVPIDETGEPIVTEIAPVAEPVPAAPAPVATTVPDVNPTFEAGGLIFQPSEPIDLTGQEVQVNDPFPPAIPPAPVSVAEQPGGEPLLIAPAGIPEQPLDPSFVPPENIPNVDTLQGIPLE